MDCINDLSYVAKQEIKMKLFMPLLLCLISLNAAAGLASKVPATAPGFSIPNTHIIDDDGQILRGMAPRGQISELVENGVTDILIFKNQTRTEVDDEIQDLLGIGYKKSSIHHIPFKWKDIEDLPMACKQTVRALAIIKDVYYSMDRKIFFHCTVGEDRTGHLSGIWDLIFYESTKEGVFKEQMCQRGYSAGNQTKPYKVVSAIRKGLSPLFFKMAKLVESGALSFDNLDEAACDKMQWVSEIPRCE